jgi:hypothetical protein
MQGLYGNGLLPVKIEPDITDKAVERVKRNRAMSLSFGSFGTEDDLLLQIQAHSTALPEQKARAGSISGSRKRSGSLSMLFANDDTFLEDCQVSQPRTLALTIRILNDHSPYSLFPQDAFNIDITLDTLAEVDNLLYSDYDSTRNLFGNGQLENPLQQIKPEPNYLKRDEEQDNFPLAKRQRNPNPKYSVKEEPFGSFDETVMDFDELKGSITAPALGTARSKVLGKGKYCRLCIEPGCTKNAQGATRKCIAHGGGRRCVVDGCTKSAQGTTPKCKAHGGGRRCVFPNCTKSARGLTSKCKAHGGGRRCGADGCNNSAAGSTFRCITHGGGRKCIIDGCTKSAAGSTAKCKAHGGGRRCQIEGCTKSAQGATYKCIAHGGGRRCSVLGCTKSAQGATDRCKTHGGGKRCNVDGCNKTVYRATDKCKAHGDSEVRAPAKSSAFAPSASEMGPAQVSALQLGLGQPMGLGLGLGL